MKLQNYLECFTYNQLLNFPLFHSSLDLNLPKVPKQKLCVRAAFTVSRHIVLVCCVFTKNWQNSRKVDGWLFNDALSLHGNEVSNELHDIEVLPTSSSKDFTKFTNRQAPSGCKMAKEAWFIIVGNHKYWPCLWTINLWIYY